MDGQRLHGARHSDGSRFFVLSAVRHGNGITLASREIGAKTNEIPEFQPLLDHVDNADLAGTVITADTLHAQHAQAAYLHQRGAHGLLTIKNNQRGQARQLHRLPWNEVPVIHRDDARGYGRRAGSRAGRHRRLSAPSATVPRPAPGTRPQHTTLSLRQKNRTDRRQVPCRQRQLAPPHHAREAAHLPLSFLLSQKRHGTEAAELIMRRSVALSTITPAVVPQFGG